MKPINQIIILTLTIFTLMSSAYAASPREELAQMVEQLQKSPTDNALREKIIRLAREVKPAPAIPEEVERRMARGEAAFELAKDVDGYDNATREFQTAANAAPWYSNAYFNLGVAQEKAGKAKAAMESFRFYLLAAPDEKDAAEVKKRIYKLEYAAEQAVASVQQFEGVWHEKVEHFNRNIGKRFQNSLHIKQGTGGNWTIRARTITSSISSNLIESDDTYPFGRDIRLEGSELRFKKDHTLKHKLYTEVCRTQDVRGTISPDGHTLSLAYTNLPFPPNVSEMCAFLASDASLPPRVDEYTRQPAR